MEFFRSFEYTLNVIKEEYTRIQDVDILRPLCTILQELKDPGLAELFSHSLSVDDQLLFYCSTRALALLDRKDLLPDLYHLAMISNDIDCKYHHGLSLLCVGDARAFDLFIEVLAYELYLNVVNKADIDNYKNKRIESLKEKRAPRKRKIYGVILLNVLCQLFNKEYVDGTLSSDKSFAFYASWINYLAENKAHMQSIDISKVKLRLLTTHSRTLRGEPL
ncbi:MAG: hypothetical protein OEV92_11740 [Nitrospinota bacterium]|nr:hypothetical protein [Nitrospinota bacterium]